MKAKRAPPVVEVRRKRTVVIPRPVKHAPAPLAAPPPAKPMSARDQENLRRAVKRREQVLKGAAEQRSAELVAEFEQQIASIYSFDQDEAWSEAYRRARDTVHEADRTIAQRCEELGIPEKFAPSLELVWHGRGQNAVAQRREELRRAAKSRITAREKAARQSIERQCFELEMRVLALGLSQAAKEILDTMPALDQMMPPLDIAEVESMLGSRGVGRRALGGDVAI